MKTEWDYTSLADAYLLRPDYATDALDEIYRITGLAPGMDACDIGAGVGHLTLHLARWKLNVVAVEPNDAMRRNGMARAKSMGNVRWVEAVSEDTKQPDASFDIVSFGSSFNVADRSKSLRETHRIVRPGRWFTCMWNHRDLEDPVQKAIEDIFHREIPGYGYGSRREDQTEVIRGSGLFSDIRQVEGRVLHRQSIADVIEAWRSHATLQRQAGENFSSIIDKVESMLQELGKPDIEIPYTTRAWVARRR